jgi:hypothetical protein
MDKKINKLVFIFALVVFSSCSDCRTFIIDFSKQYQSYTCKPSNSVRCQLKVQGQFSSEGKILLKRNINVIDSFLLLGSMDSVLFNEDWFDESLELEIYTKETSNGQAKMSICFH